MSNTDKELLIMIVDDSRMIRAYFCDILMEAGFSVIEAETGEEALNYIMQGIKPEAIILDIEMPGMGGFEACRKIKELPMGLYIPIMIATGLEDMRSIKTAFESGATDFVTKPFKWDLIPYRLQYIIRNNHNLIELNQSKMEVLKTQENIKHLNEQLEQRVISRTQELQEKNEELQTTLKTLKQMQAQLVESEKMASLGSLVAGIAHEINTPIGNSLTAISHLDEELLSVTNSLSKKALTQSQLTRFLDIGLEAVKITKVNLQHSVELIKSFKQVSVDQASETKNEFNVKEYFNEILYSLQPTLNKHHMSVQFNCVENLVIESYPGILFQVITILVMNTIKHAYNENEPGLITIDVNLEGTDLKIEYADKGKGISEENLKKIFDPFFTTKRSEGSVGIGLHIAYNQIKKILKGTIDFESKLNFGTKTTIIFPCISK